ATGHPFPGILTFSVIAGAGELVPTIGPILAGLPPVLMALSIHPMLAVWVVLLFLVIHQIENNLLVPLVMGHTLRIHPVSIAFSILMMSMLFGLLGIVLATPVCAIAKVCWEEFYLKPVDADPADLEEQAARIVGPRED